MYEDNRPLPPGDFATLFADFLADIEHHARKRPPSRITPANVLQWAHVEVQPGFAKICRRLLLPGSGVAGTENLAQLASLAAGGSACILCLNHRSNLDVPTLYALLEDASRLELFHRLIWIAGRKLNEDVGSTRTLVGAFNRVVVSPRSWMREEHSQAELHEAHEINVAAHRVIHDLRHQGWVFALFPTATRIRPGDESTTHAIEETDSYLKTFDYMVLGRIDGCTLPVSRDRDLTHETPRLDRVRYAFGPVLRSGEWRAAAAERYRQLDPRAASARAIIEDIMALAPPFEER
jgi:glycerol-3-phosphate O-acyltransferase